jgi:SAM-dependent methyltransferase
MDRKNKEFRLNLGSGYFPRKGYINLDFEDRKQKGFEFVKCDLNKKLPFEDNSVSEIFSNHTLEHIENLYGLMEEIRRICCNGAKIKIVVPHFTAPPYEFHIRSFRYDMLLDYAIFGGKYTSGKRYQVSMINKPFIDVTNRKLVFEGIYSFMNIINISPKLCRWYEYSFLRSLFLCGSVIFEGIIKK